jgi:hypothetical protein
MLDQFFSAHPAVLVVIVAAFLVAAIRRERDRG